MHDDASQKYEFLCKISEGAYGTVWKAVNKHDGAVVAVKKMKSSPTNQEVGTTPAVTTTIIISTYLLAC